MLLESAILGTVNVPVGGLTSYTLTTANGAADQSRPFTQMFTGALTADCIVTIPNEPKLGQAINATTGGFNIILTSGAGTTIIVSPENLPYAYYADGATNVIIRQVQPGPRFGDFKYNALPIEGGGWRMAYGQTRPRTDPLWQWITAQSIAWPFGNGDGSTTYTMPDMRGHALFGIDNMGGTAANRVTAGISGIAGSTNGATGGSQSLTAHTHTVSVTDAGHTHVDAGHAHGITDPTHQHFDLGHVHTIADPGHIHTITDPTHNHNLPANTLSAGNGIATGSSIFGLGPTYTYNAPTGISINLAYTGITSTSLGYAPINFEPTGISCRASVHPGIT